MIATRKLRVLLLGMMTLFILFSGCKPERIDDIGLVSEQSSSSRALDCMLTISGEILDIKDFTPIEGAVVTSKFFTAKTNKDGLFEVQIKVSEAKEQDLVQVEKDGYIINEFPVFYDAILDVDDCAALTNVNWSINLSETKEFVWIGPREGAWYKIMDTIAYRGAANEVLQLTRLYTVDIARGTTDDWANISVSPDNSRAIGRGIPVSYRLLSLDNFIVIEDRFGRARSRNTDDIIIFNKEIEVVLEEPEDVSFNAEFFVYYACDDSVDEIGFTEIHHEQKVLFKLKQTGRYSLYDDLESLNFAISQEASIMDGNTDNIFFGFGSNFGANTPSVFRSFVKIDSDREQRLQTIRGQIFGNCECNDGIRSFTFDVSLDANQNLPILFGVGTSPGDIEKANRFLQSLLIDSGNSNLRARLSFSLEECSSARTTSTETRRTARGSVLGFRFNYEATIDLETTITIQNSCSFDVDSGCHQGC